MSSQIPRWEKRFAVMNDEYRCLVARGLWVSGPSDFLSIIGQAEVERTHSRMLAWLLTPTGRHGLRNLLLTRLLEHYDSKHKAKTHGNVPPSSGIVRAVECLHWYWRDNNRKREADIVAWGEDFRLVIEMKVGGGEGERQLEDLYEHFRGPGARFLFLTKRGDPPKTVTTSSDAERAFETISWPEVCCMIEDALKHPVSKKGTAVSTVENYLITLKENFR